MNSTILKSKKELFYNKYQHILTKLKDPFNQFLRQKELNSFIISQLDFIFDLKEQHIINVERQRVNHFLIRSLIIGSIYEYIANQDEMDINEVIEHIYQEILNIE